MTRCVIPSARWRSARWVDPNLKFRLVGLLTLAFAVGLVRLRGARHKVGGILVGIWGVGLIGAGAFVTDPASGYPPGTPPTPVEATASGTLHDLFSVAAFFALGAACFVFAGGRGWSWAIYSVLSGAAFLGAFFVAGIGFGQTEPFVEVAGLWQRVCVIIGWAWLTILALRLLREERRRAFSPVCHSDPQLTQPHRKHSARRRLSPRKRAFR